MMRDRKNYQLSFDVALGDLPLWETILTLMHGKGNLMYTLENRQIVELFHALLDVVCDNGSDKYITDVIDGLESVIAMKKNIAKRHDD